MALALEREHYAVVAGAVLADPEPMLARLVRGCITLWSSLLAYLLLHAATAMLTPSRAASSIT